MLTSKSCIWSMYSFKTCEVCILFKTWLYLDGILNKYTISPLPPCLPSLQLSPHKCETGQSGADQGRNTVCFIQFNKFELKKKNWHHRSLVICFCSSSFESFKSSHRAWVTSYSACTCYTSDYVYVTSMKRSHLFSF